MHQFNLMTNYAAQYYILRRDDNDALPYLEPDDDSAGRSLGEEPQPPGSPALTFSNALKQRNRVNGIQEVITPVLFHGHDLLVKSSVREALLELDLAHVHWHRAVYIDDLDRWHEDYWHITFSRNFDCWDRDRSDVSENFVESDGERRHDVYEYVLDEDLLDKTPLKERLLFQMGGTIEGFVFCHESIVDIFRRETPPGAQILLSTDY